MPSMDGTGPSGRGPMTGRGAGNCVVGRGGRGARGGNGRGFGFFGRAQGSYVSLSKEEQKKILQEEKKDIENSLKELE